MLGKLSCDTQACDWKVKGSISGRSRRKIFFSRISFTVLTLIWYPFEPYVTTVACKRQQSFCQKCRWQVTANLYTLLTKWSLEGLTMLSRHSVGTHQGNEFTQHLSGDDCPLSSELTEPLWTDPWPNRVELVHAHWSPLTLKKKCRWEMIHIYPITLEYKEKSYRHWRHIWEKHTPLLTPIHSHQSRSEALVW